MTEDEKVQQLLDFFKALADANRLKIVGLLAQQDLSVEQIAEMLGISSSTASHHLSRLNKTGLVSARTESYYNVYHLNEEKLESLSKKILSKETLPEVTANIDLDAYDSKVVRNYTNPDGTIKTIPTQQKKVLAILKYIVKDFEPDRKYSEKEVNEILEHYNEDYVQLRRELIEFKFMARETGGKSYWLLKKE